VLIFLLGAAVFAYTQGYGFPTQEQVVTDFFTSYAQGEDVDEYWVSSGQEDAQAIARILDGVAPSSNITINTTVRTMGNSEVWVGVTLPEGGVVNYKIQLARDFLSWRINGIELVFASTTP
jgi:hypothetical protein